MNPLAWKKSASEMAPAPTYPGVTALPAPPDDATKVIWHDPSSYNPYFHGPPYLPGMHVRMDQKAASKQANSGLEGLPAALIMLRALSAIHQAHHWLTYGEAYYADHLLFERLYNETEEEIDQVAEKALGLGTNRSFLHPGFQTAHVSKWVQTFCGNGWTEGEGENPTTYVQTSLKAETWFLGQMKKIAETMKAMGSLSRGADNLLAGIEDKHEGHVYLLTQRSQVDPWKVG